ncbi:MAG TPA: M28 family peptidase [Gemmatimonadales bacterium]|nr:M28 family peptidase [Gemmatimonadales bacterium]
MQRHIGVLADDSMRGRDTPSPELEEVARYIAAQFRRSGLAPGGDAGSYLQRYRILRRQVDTSASFLAVRGPHPGTLKLGIDVSVLGVGRPPPRGDASGPVVVLNEPPDVTHPLGGVNVAGAWVVAFAAASPGGGALDSSALRVAARAGAVGILLIFHGPDPVWQGRLARSLEVALSLESAGEPAGAALPPVVEIRDAAAASVLGLDWTVRRAGGPRRLAGVTLTLRLKQRLLYRASAPNVIGILPGSDPALRHQYVFFTAHMDHLGVAGPSGTGACQPLGADSICNGADDDASGTAAVIENAAAFAQLVPHPRRSLVFMTVSGEEKGLWGSSFFVAHPTVPLAHVVADLNADMVGRNWKDTIVAIGKEQSDLGATLDSVAAAHPELDMTPIGDLWPEENFYFRSDHYNFARRGVPILFFFNGTHADYHQASDSPDKIDAEKEARIIKLVFYLGLAIANAPERPRWNPESYRQIVRPAP